MIQIIICDDHLLINDWLKSWLLKNPNLSVIGEASNGHEVIDLLNNGLVPDILLLDIKMEPMNGYDTAKYVYDNFKEVGIICISVFSEPLAITKIAACGARAYVDKNKVHANLYNAIMGVYQNGYFANEWLTKEQIEYAIANPTDFSFTEDEKKYIQQMSTDLPYKAIAAKNKMTIHQFELKRKELFARFCAKTRAKVIDLAHRTGLL